LSHAGQGGIHVRKAAQERIAVLKSGAAMRGIDRIFPGPAAASSVERMNLADPDLKPEIEALNVNDLRYRPWNQKNHAPGLVVNRRAIRPSRDRHLTNHACILY
jgi:hypothetical protein